MKIKKLLIKYLNKLPYIRGLHNQQSFLKKNLCFPVGHFYSPIVLVDQIEKRSDKIWENSEKEGIKGIDLNTEQQISLLNQLSVFYTELPFKDEKQDGIRYNYINNYYSYTDAITLYLMIRYRKPKRIIEIGSGFSSAVMLDTNELFFDSQINLTFIEPFPERLHSLLKESDKKKVTIIANEVQFVSIDIFEQLESGDILFIDSSHVAKTGSDVNFIIFEILTVLKKGVIVHFHDIFYPFEYPKNWVLKGMNWNENYFLKSFLLYNKQFKIMLFSHYLHVLHSNSFSKMSLCYKNWGGNLWIEKQ